MPTAATRRSYDGPALFSFGFRPFFLFGSAWAAVVVPLWVVSIQGGGALTREWHVHEMLFGYLAAIVAGFLTTSVPNWTGRMPVIGMPLAALVGLWGAGRGAMLRTEGLGSIATLIDCAFLFVFAAVVWREIIAGRNWRNLPVCLLISAFALAHVAFHLDSATSMQGVGARAALAAAGILLALIGGRIIPSFTGNWMRANAIGFAPPPPGLPDRLALAFTVAGVVLWAAFPETPASGAALALAGAANFFRLARWGGRRTGREPLVWVLHLGYGWLATALLLLGLSVLTLAIPKAAGLHALTVGAIGVMTLAVMTRASRGHTGRPLRADGPTAMLYVAINTAALARVASSFGGAAQPALLALSATLWAAAFGGFAMIYAPMLITRRLPPTT